ncbi:hypothetical protein BGW39_001918 [Mortierella sp. 14UC]|nr:hypothetical protein BGW39_001918 [Mortierella sp. 14UC]
MYFDRWYSQRAYILITAAVLVAQWLFLGHPSPLSYLSSSGEAIPSEPMIWDEDQQGQHAVDKILYADDIIGGIVENKDIVNSEEGNDNNGINRAPKIVTAARVQGGELDDSEDPNYYNKDPERPRVMSFWFPDWLLNKTRHPSILRPETISDLELAADNNHEFATNATNPYSPTRPRRPATLDIVYTWVNGSDPEWQYGKHHYMRRDTTLRKINANDIVETRMTNRFRDNNELLYSVRSSYKFGGNMVRKVHITTTDVIEETLWKSMLGEDVDGASSSGVSDMEEDSNNKKTEDSSSKPRAGLTTHIETSETNGQKVAPTLQKRAWLSLDDMLANAHKMADEAKNKKESTEAPQAEEMRKPMQGDYWTPQYGLVFQVALDCKVRPGPIVNDWKCPLARGYEDNLEFPNLQLSKRFGYRFRPQITHIVHIASRSILKEEKALWPEVFVQSGRGRFRSDCKNHVLQPMSLMAHYTIERLREIQLHTFAGTRSTTTEMEFWSVKSDGHCLR